MSGGRSTTCDGVSRTRAWWTLVAGVVLLAGCAGRPEVDQLTESILRADAADDGFSLTDDQADCIADELLDSDLGDETLSGLAESFDEATILASDVDEVEQVVADAAVTCLGS